MKNCWPGFRSRAMTAITCDHADFWPTDTLRSPEVKSTKQPSQRMAPGSGSVSSLEKAATTSHSRLPVANAALLGAGLFGFPRFAVGSFGQQVFPPEPLPAETSLYHSENQANCPAKHASASKLRPFFCTTDRLVAIQSPRADFAIQYPEIACLKSSYSARWLTLRPPTMAAATLRRSFRASPLTSCAVLLARARLCLSRDRTLKRSSPASLRPPSLAWWRKPVHATS